VNLVIRARQEGDRAIKTVTDALNGLFAAQDHVGDSAASTSSRVGQMVATLAQVDRVASTLAGTYDSAAAATSRQAQAIHAANVELDAQRERVVVLTRGLDILRAEADKAFIGPRRNGLTETIKGAQADLSRAENAVARLSKTVDQQLSSLGRSRSALRDLRTGSTEAADAQARLTAQIELDTRALAEQAVAAERVTAIQARINAVTGVTRSTGAPAADRADLLLRADAEYGAAQKATEAAAVRDAAIAYKLFEDRVRAGGVALREASAAQDTSNLRDAAIAHKLFEDRVRTGAAAMREADAAAEAEAQALARLRAEINPLAAIQEALNNKLRQARDAHAAGKLSALELAEAEKVLAANAARAAAALDHGGRTGKKGIFGLQPYEVQNLGYQVNDLVTQVASGTSIFQAMAQQGGQILQLLPQMGSRLLALATNPFFLAGAVAVGAVVLALNEAASAAERLRGFDALLTLNADGANYQSAALEKTVVSLRRYGVAASESTAALRTFVNEGIAPDRLEAFTRTARDMSDVLGVKVPDAAKQLADAFTGGYDAIARLDDATNVLTASQRDHIRTLFEEGNAQGARAEAYRIISAQFEESAAKQRGPWTEAVRSLGGAWQSFLDVLSKNGPAEGAMGFLEGLASGVSDVLNLLSGTQTLATLNKRIALQAQVYAGAVELLTLDGKLQYRARDTDNEEGVKRARELNALLAERAKLLAPKPATTDTVNDEAASAKADRDAVRRLTLEEELQRLREKGEKGLSESERKRREFLAGQLAYNKASGGEIVKAAERSLALDKERNTIAKEQERLSKASTVERERRNRELRDVDLQQSAGILSSAKKYEGLSETRDKSALGELFKQANVNVDPEMTAWCAAFVNAVLGANGIKGTGSLSARSFLNFGKETTSPNPGDVVVLRRGKNEAQGHVGFFQGYDDKGGVRVLGGNTGDKVATSTFKASDVLSYRQAPNQADVARQIAEVDKRQDALNQKVDDENARRLKTVETLTVEGTLTGEKLIAAQRAQAIEEEVLKVEQEYAKLRKAGATVDPAAERERLELVRATAGAEFDVSHQRQLQAARRATADQPVADLTAQREAIQKQIKFFNETGQFSLADNLKPQLSEVNDRLNEAIEKAKAFYAALAGDGAEAEAARNNLGLTKDQVANVTLGLESAQAATQTLGYVMGVSLDDAAQQFASGATSAFDKFAQAVAAGANVFRSIKNAFLGFASDFLRQIAQMIEQQIIFNLVSGLLRSFGGATGSANGVGAIGGLQAHDGGIIGGAGPVARMISPSLFDVAMRYHLGGVAGLKPNEVPAILERGEEVLTRSDPRHRANAGAGGGGGGGDRAGNVTTILVDDRETALERALRTPAGERTLIQFVRDNSGAFRGALGV
jgi:uncharacterized protein (TIGR02594 family)